MSYPSLKNLIEKSNGWLVVFGGFLMHLTLGSLYCFGNMTPYLTSYLRYNSHDPDVRYSDSVFIFASSCAGQSISMYFGGLIIQKYGPRYTGFVGSMIMSAGILLSYFTCKISLFAVTMTYGVCVGLGTGIAYTSPMVVAHKWLPDYKGLVNGIIVSGFGGSAFIFDLIQSNYINPDGKDPTEVPYDKSPHERYYQAEEVEKVPECFLLLGVIYIILQLIGVSFFQYPEEKKEVNKMLVDIPRSSSYDEDFKSPLIDAEVSYPSPSQIHYPTSNQYKENNALSYIKYKQFILLWIMFLLDGFYIVFVSTLFQIFGQTFIHDNKFITTVASIGALFNAIGRISFGRIADKYSWKISLIILMVTNTIFLGTFIFTQYLPSGVFFLYVCVLFACIGGNYSLFPTATNEVFGPKNFATVYGLIFTSQLISMLTGAFVLQNLADTLDWIGMMLLFTLLSFVSFILCLSIKVKPLIRLC